ncbi:MAG: FkbM family methyltransferase [Armatimonadetes bacterium]|jgi:FkbM family methyltransferase|nr:FkbM family methyltransferase [Armatimonadota bacterium]
MIISPDRLPGFLRPECVLRPSQLILRLMRSSAPPASAESRLPWGLPIRYHPDEVIGREIWKLGIFEICVCEVLWRLTDPGEHALDIGSNIGQMASLLAARVGSTGSVSCFEPHPSVFTELAENAAVWSRTPGTGRLTLFNLALSDRIATMTLSLPAGFQGNRGIAHLMDTDAAMPGDEFEQHSVTTTTLDALSDGFSPISVIKMDVEGHEISVLKGATTFFERHQPRDILFEDHAGYPSPVTDHLEELGYRILSIRAGMSGPFLGAATGGGAQHGRDYLATLDPERVRTRMRRRGWSVLSQ